MTTPVLLAGLTGSPEAILIDGERIVAVGADAVAAGDGARRVEFAALRAVPGFIELQVNGTGDDDVTGEPAALWRLAACLPRHGVTAFLPTVVSAPRPAVEAAMAALAKGPPSVEGGIAVPLGLHVEGPYLASARRGAHPLEHLRDPDLDELREWIAGGVRLVTLAPERSGALAAIESIVADGAVAAIGHTDADGDTTARAIDAGARYATHLFNAMPPLHHRAPGPVGVLLDDERVTVGLIADGVHVDRRLLRLVARLAPRRVSLVSDAVASRLGDAAVIDDAGVARLADGTLAGGAGLLDHGVRTFADAIGSADAAIEAVTAVPARLLGLDDGRGDLRVGGRADVVLLDDGLAVAATIVGGRPAHLSERVAWP